MINSTHEDKLWIQYRKTKDTLIRNKLIEKYVHIPKYTALDDMRYNLHNNVNNSDKVATWKISKGKKNIDICCNHICNIDKPIEKPDASYNFTKKTTKKNDVLRLHKNGYEIRHIAKELEIGIGEIKLIININKLS